MSFLLILPLGQAGGGEVREELIRRFRLDYTHVLQMTLEVWDALESGDNDIIHAALESYLHRRLSRRRKVTFEEMLEAVYLAATAASHFYETIQPHLQDIIDRHITATTPELQLKGWLASAPVIQVSLKNETIPNLHRFGSTHMRGLEGLHGHRDLLVLDGSRPEQSV